MSFVRKQVDTERSFGAELKELRELRGWSMEQLARATGIPHSMLQALEDERLEEFRDPSYAEHHVKAAVKALDGRVGFFMHKYRLLLEGRGQSKPEVPLTFFARIKRSALFVPSKYLLWLVPIPLALVLGWYVWRQATDLSAPPVLTISQPAENVVLKHPTVTIAGMTDPSASVSVNGQAAVVQASGDFSVTFNIPRGMTKLTVTSRRRYGGVSQLVRYVTYAPEYAPAILDKDALLDATVSATSTSSTP
jgi:transcriptional regulator with XRE-family HTH domain